jgi:hypothetical protein
MGALGNCLLLKEGQAAACAEPGFPVRQHFLNREPRPRNQRRRERLTSPSLDFNDQIICVFAFMTVRFGNKRLISYGMLFAFGFHDAP